MLPATKTARLVASAASDNAALAFNGPVCLSKIIGFNARAGTIFLKIYENSPAQIAGNTPPVAADTPELTIALPASSAFALDIDMIFNRGFGYRLVTGSADADATAIAANDILGLNFLGR